MATSVQPSANEVLLDTYMPKFDVIERRSIHIAAPAEAVFAAACAFNLEDPWIIRTIIRARELILGSRPASSNAPDGLIAQTKAMGWGMLSEVPGREIVMGAVTQPWSPNVSFRPVSPGDYAAHSEPDQMKIVWNLRADPVSETESILSTETRVVACDEDARRKFRRYWRCFWPGIVLIRVVALRHLKRAIERKGARCVVGLDDR